jgi:hypothetical protein
VTEKFDPELVDIRERQKQRGLALWVNRNVDIQDTLQSKMLQIAKTSNIDTQNLPEWVNGSDLNAAFAKTSQNIISAELLPAYTEIDNAKMEVGRNKVMTSSDKAKQLDYIKDLETQAWEASNRYLQLWVDQVKKLTEGKTPDEAIAELDKEYLAKYWYTVSNYIRSAFKSFDPKRTDQEYFKVKDLVSEWLWSVRDVVNSNQNSDVTGFWNWAVWWTQEGMSDLTRSYLSPIARRRWNTSQLALAWRDVWMARWARGWALWWPATAAAWSLTLWWWLMALWWIVWLVWDLTWRWPIKTEWSMAELNNTSLLNIKLKEWDKSWFSSSSRWDFFNETSNSYTNFADNVTVWLVAFKWAGQSSALLTNVSSRVWANVWFYWQRIVGGVWLWWAQSTATAAKVVWQALDKWIVAGIQWRNYWDLAGRLVWNVFLENVIINGAIQPGLSEMYTSDPMNMFRDLTLSSAMEWVSAIRSWRKRKWDVNLYDVIVSDPISRKVFEAAWIKTPTKGDLKNYSALAAVWGKVINSIQKGSANWNTMLKYMYFQSEVKNAVRDHSKAKWLNFTNVLNTLLW